jgi:hypothetical protein
MKKATRFSLLLACCSLISCNQQSSSSLSSEVAKVDSQEAISKPTIHNGNLDMSETQIPFPTDYAEYLSQSIHLAIKVISGQSKLTQTDLILGVGSDQAPKGPGSKLVRFYEKNISGKNFESSFTKTRGEENWTKADLGYYTKNYPITFYKMNLPATFFSGMVLDSATMEEQVDNPIKQLNIFNFKTQLNEKVIKVSFKASNTISSLDDKYPRNFHSVEVSLY